MFYTEHEVWPLWLHVSVLVTWLIHCFLLLFFFSAIYFVFPFFVLCFRFEFCDSVLGFVILFWVLCFCFGFRDSVLSFVFLYWVLWFCFEFCVSVLGFVILFCSVSATVRFNIVTCCLLYSEKRSTYTEQRPHHASENRLQEDNNDSKQWQHWKMLKPSGHSNRNVTQLSANQPRL